MESNTATSINALPLCVIIQMNTKTQYYAKGTHDKRVPAAPSHSYKGQEWETSSYMKLNDKKDKQFSYNISKALE